jgi:uncharacterized protein YqjF (DUF2071 family)
VTFVHWAYEPARVRPLLPAGTEPDLFDGVAYVGLVAFRMHSFGAFLETNVRTYTVDGKGRRGVAFLTMEADRLAWVLASKPGVLPYRWADMSLTRHGDRLHYRSRRRWPGSPGLRSRLLVEIGDPVEGTALDHFLTARWRLHNRFPGRTLLAGLWHERWPLHSAKVLELADELIAGTGLPAPAGQPASVLYAPRVSGRIGLPRPA